MSAEPSAGISCNCGSGEPALVVACSGASDVGEIADHAARRLAREGVAQMYCLAGVGARLAGMVETAKSASGLLVIDGCATACGKHAVKGAGIGNFLHLQIRDLGLVKGSTPVDDAAVERVASRARDMIEACGKGCCGT